MSVAQALELLNNGQIELQGLVPWSSNYTFLITVSDVHLQALAVYKPCRGERPLWDFPPHTLCQREVAAYVLSLYLGWPDIPPVILREGPHGKGSVQLFVEADTEEHYFTMRERPEYDDAFRRIALFDYVVNNADRKGGHVLKGIEGKVWCIDHGLTFHAQPKLRTVIWDYAGQPIPGEWLAELQALRDKLHTDDAPEVNALARLIDPQEIRALRRRLDALIRGCKFPSAEQSQRNVPYPLV
ncbi:MAG: hypothetical protein A2Y73_05090 [Chloroflexi bacterium RBG_13_56_8]|nr:MAG: hypothetical protein A2Y73_05090 [Chloroflexi bacterium RBG_13_56_8]